MINIKDQTAKMLKEKYQIDEEITTILFEKGILREDILKKILLKEEYRQKVEPKGRQILKHKLAKKYCVSVKLIEKIIE